MYDMTRIATCLFFAALLLGAQNRTDRTKVIRDEVHQLRNLPDTERAKVTRQLALQIRQLPSAASRLSLAEELTNSAAQGDLGRDTLQDVTTTLAQALTEHRGSRELYLALARLVRYEHMQVSLDNPQLKAATAQLEDDDHARQRADFTLTDLNGKSWSLRSLPGKIVLVNFWATWCPPCREEIPDLEALYGRFENSGLVILAISNEGVGKVRPFIADRKVSYPVLLDKGGKVTELFRVEGIPRSFLYDRQGNLVAQAIAMRTQGQFLEMLAQAGLK
jgi:peroxiredoxin